MKSSIVNRKQLMAAVFTAATKDIRYYLNGVYVEATSKETRVISTDGTVLSDQRFACDNEGFDGVVSFIIPLSICKAIKSHKSYDNLLISTTDDKTYILKDGNADIAFIPVDGKFPDYRRVIPSEVSNEVAHYCPDNSIKFKKVSDLFKTQMYVLQNGNSAGFVGLIGELDYIGVIMPIRICNNSYSIPSIHNWTGV